MVQRRLARQRLDPADPGAGGAVAQDHHRPDVAGAGHMGAAAKLQAVGPAVRPLARPVQHAHRHDAHLIAVFFAEQGLGADGAGVVWRHDPGIHRGVLADEGVHLGLDHGQVRGRDRRRMAEVEPQPVRGVQAAALRDMVAQAAPQRLVQKVRGGMVGADRRTTAVRDLQLGGLALAHRAFGDARDVDEDPGGLFNVGHLGQPGLGADQARIADLAAAFGVKRGLVDHDLHGFAGGRLTGGGTVADQGGDHALGRFGVVTQKFGDAMRLGDLEPDLRITRRAGTRPGGAGLLLLLGHRGVKARDVHLAPVFAERVLRQVQREAIGVIELEGRRPGQGRALRQGGEFIIQKAQATVQRLLEPGFLQPQR